MNTELAISVLKEKGKSFYWAQKLLRREQALNAALLYAVCRQIDDLVDEADSPELARKNLQEFRQETLNSEFFIKTRIPVPAFLELTYGVESDLDVVAIRTEAELIHYCYQVAGTVGIMMCKVLQVNDPRAIQHASDLGIAMQLTNICRDVKDDARLERRYLPESMVGNISLRELESPSLAQLPALNRTISTLLTLADHYYQSGEMGLCYLPFRSRFAILVAARLYRAIGVKLAKNGGNYWNARIALHPFQKLSVTFGALLDFVTTPSLLIPPVSLSSDFKWK